MPALSEIIIYPVKSFAGSQLTETVLDRFGPAGDRRWLVVDAAGRFLSQREIPAMALFAATVTAGGLRLSHAGEDIDVPRPTGPADTPVQIWRDPVQACDAGAGAAAWLSERLGAPCRLVYMPDTCRRPVDRRYATAGQTVSFADNFPLLLIAQASLDDLNRRLRQPVPMNRFRPNLVVTGCAPHAEDNWRLIQIGDVVLDVAKPCTRCVIPSIDQATAAADSEILRVLASYRRGEDRQTRFGQNLLYHQPGRLRVGDAVAILH